MTAARVHPLDEEREFEERVRLRPLAKGTHPKGDSVEELTGVCRDTLEAEIRAGRLKPTRVRGRVMVRGENLLAWMRLCEAEASQAVTVRGRRRRSDRRLDRVRDLEEAREVRAQVLTGLAGGGNR